MFQNGGIAAAVVTLLIAAWVACDNMIVLIRLAEKTGKSSYGQVCVGVGVGVGVGVTMDLIFLIPYKHTSSITSCAYTTTTTTTTMYYCYYF